MLPEGKLYVPGAEDARDEMGRLVAAAREAGVVHVATADDHELTDPEISSEPDFLHTFPPHCLRGTPGSQRIPETAQGDPLPLPTTACPPGLVPALIDGRRELLLLKKTFSPFSNPNAEALLEALDPDEIVVFGVATDICAHQAIMGFLQRGRRVTFVEDAARGLSEERVAACTALWRERGVRFATADEAVELLLAERALARE
jgi:nicotinamidase/pyrazinamidase